MNWHWENLNKDRQWNVKGSGFWFGRAWLNFGKTFGRSMRLEWQFGKFMFRLKLSFDPNDREIMFSFAVPGVSLYFSVGGFKFLRNLRNGRDFGITVHDWAFWWSIWEDKMEWNSRDPWWMRGCLHIDDLFLGRVRVTSEIVETKSVVIPMPEGAYPATAKLTRVTSKRSRWFKSIVIREVLQVTSSGSHAWCGSDIGIIRKPIASIHKDLMAEYRNGMGVAQ